MKDNLQKSLKAVIEESDALIKDVGTREPTDAENTKLAELAEKAAKLSGQIDNVSKIESIKELAGKSAGSYVAASFSREANPGEGDIPGVTSDPNGEMYAVDGQFKSMGEKKLEALKSGGYKDAFADYVRTAGLGRSMKGDAMKILNEGTDTSGGFWLPPDYRPDLIKRTATMSSVRQNASVFTTGSDHITFPQVQYTGASSDDALATLFTSGTRFSWRGSNGSTSDYSESTNPIAGQINIPVHLATAAIIVTREQLEDNSFDLLGYIAMLGAEAFGLGEESAFTNGSGAGQPQGFMSHPAKAIAATTTSAVNGVTYTGTYIPTGTTTGLPTWTSTAGSGYGITGLEADLPPQYETGAKWYANKKAYAAIRQINAGTSTLPQWALGDAYPNYANNMQASLLGYAIQKNQFMPAVGTDGNYPIALGDLKGYYIVDRVGLSVEVFREVYGLRDQVVIYMRKRTGGQLVKYWSMRFLKLGSS